MSGAPQSKRKNENHYFKMSHLQKLIREANKADKDFKDKQRKADSAAKRKAEIAAFRRQDAADTKEIRALRKVLKEKQEARKRREAISGAGVISRVERGGKAVEQLVAALTQNPEERMSKEQIGGKGSYFRRYIRRRKRPYVRKGKKSILQKMYYDRKRRQRRSLYDEVYKRVYPAMEMEPEELLAKFDAISKKRTASSRSTPDTSPPRLAIKVEDLGALLTY